MNMKFHYTNLETCHAATGFVVVIDVIRAFTNAAYVFSRGAKEIHPVSKVKEALQFKAHNPGALACGEVDGIPPEGFDFGNSPSQVLTLDLDGKTVVQRTGAGTQGVALSQQAETMLAASFVVANATAKYIRKLAPPSITFVVTGQTFSTGGDEDLACAHYLEELLKGETPDPAPFLQRVRNSGDAQVFYDPARPEFPQTDIDHCTAIDKFDFVMHITRENGRHVMRAVQP
jgi:2-phosphosulfolactate phosphatase